MLVKETSIKSCPISMETCMVLIGNSCFEGTPGVLKHCSGVPMSSPDCPLKTHDLTGFTFLAISPLILVRFSKFKIWHTRESKPLVADLSMVARATIRAKSRHARDVTILSCVSLIRPQYTVHDVMSLTLLT